MTANFRILFKLHIDFGMSFAWTSLICDSSTQIRFAVTFSFNLNLERWQTLFR